MRQRKQQPGGFKERRQQRKAERKERRQQRKTERTKQRQQRKTERTKQRQQRKTERTKQRQERKAQRIEQRQERKTERTKQRQERKAQRIERREQRRRDGRLRVKRAVVGTNRFLGRARPPLPDPDFVETPTKSARVSVLSALLCLALAALAVSGKIVEIADRLPLGAERDRWLATAEGADRIGNWMSLNRPYDALRHLRGAGDDAGQLVDVIGDLEDLLAANVEAGPDPLAAAATTVPATPAPDSTLAATTVDTAEAETPSEPPDAAGFDDPASPSGDVTEDPVPAAIAAPQDANRADAPSLEDPAASTGGGPEVVVGTAPLGLGDLTKPATAGTEPSAQEPDEEGAAEVSPLQLRPIAVSEEAPLRTYVAGDSQAFFLGVELRGGSLKAVLDLILDQRHSTGLARPAYFNWPVQLHSVSADIDPELFVLTLGSNDWQDMRTPDGDVLRRGRDEWAAEWGRRLGVMFDLLEAPHRHIVWVGLPPTRGDDFREGYAVMNEISAQVAAERDFVTMIDIWEMFGGDESYRASVPPPGDPGGSPVLVRQRDGVHLNRRGAEWVVAIVEEEIRRIWDPVDG